MEKGSYIISCIYISILIYLSQFRGKGPREEYNLDVGADFPYLLSFLCNKYNHEKN